MSQTSTPTDTNLDNANAYCAQKAAQSGSSFYYAFLFLPLERRQAITALYAYCREVDDVVDECSDLNVAQTKLAWWEKEIERLYSKHAATQAQHPVSRALLPHLEKYQIQQADLLAILRGMQMDLEQSRYLDYANLQTYCHHVAGVVGLLAARIFGQSDPATSTYAAKLGLAFQLTNIIRDVGEDARKGRIYLPIEDLQRFNVKAHEILKGEYSERFEALMQFQAQRAREAYADALAALPAVDRRPQRPGLIMATVYHALLEEIIADKFQVLHQRVSLTPIRKLWLAWSTWVLRWRTLRFSV